MQCSKGVQQLACSSRGIIPGQGFGVASRRVQEEQLILKLTSFAAWLPQHGHLMHSLELLDLSALGKPTRSMAEQFLAVSMQVAGTAGRRPLRLQRFLINEPNKAVLAVLPDGLTELKLGVNASYGTDVLPPTAVWDTLVRLTQLRALDLDNTSRPPLDMAPLSGLCHLTRLELRYSVPSVQWPNLQQACRALRGLEVLVLRLYKTFDSEDRTPLALSLDSLTALTRLSLVINHALSGKGTVCPSSLRELSLNVLWSPAAATSSPVVDLGIMGFRDLRKLKLELNGPNSLFELPGSVQALQQMTQLQCLELQYSCQGVHDDRSHWASLPALQSLTIREWAPEALQAQLLSTVSGRTGLTHLEMTLVAANAGGSLAVCHHLSGLTKLQKLCLFADGGKFAAQDCMWLSTLTNLTQLELYRWGRAVGDTVAVALACNMPRLRHLNLTECDLRSDAVKPVFDRLNLTKLVLNDNPGFQ